MAKANNWTTIAESKFPWERDALDYVREKFPAFDPYRAWANFEFIADDGSVNEVDLLVFSPQGFFLVEIKSRRGGFLVMPELGPGNKTANLPQMTIR